MKEIPRECKYIKTCSFHVDGDHFEHICSTQNWIHCEWIAPSDLREYKQTPSEWEKVKGKQP